MPGLCVHYYRHSTIGIEILLGTQESLLTKDSKGISVLPLIKYKHFVLSSQQGKSDDFRNKAKCPYLTADFVR